MIDNTFPTLLEKNVNLEECIQWFKDPSQGPPTGMAEALGFDGDHLEVLRLEMPLLLLNFIREQSSKILQDSQNCSKTPSKANHPSKYDYMSPVKTLRKSMAPKHLSVPEKRGNKKRVQLFTSPRKESVNPSGGGKSPFQELETVEINDDLIFKKLGVESAESKFSSIEERYTGSFAKKTNVSAERLKLGSNSSVKKVTRRSLDSATSNISRPYNSGTPHSRSSGSSLNLGDFIVKSSSNKKQRSRNKNRQSDSALLEQARSASPSLAEKALKPKEIKEEEKDEIKVTEEIELPISNPGDIDNCKVEENYSPTKIVRPKFERCDSLTKFIDPDPLKVTNGTSLSQLASLYSFFIENHLVPNVLVEIYLLLELLTVKAEDDDDDICGQEDAMDEGIFSTVHNCVFFSTHVLSSQVELLQFTDSLTLKYLLSNERLDVFCPEVKPKLNYFMEESIRLKKRHGSGEEKFEENFKIPTVNYQPDTDSKDNFPGNASQDFAKQRDMFYDLVKKWNEHERSGSHLMPDFYAPAVSRMLCLQTHPVNMLHFAELFQEQLVSMTKLELTNQDLSDAQKSTEKIGILSEFQSKQPGKFKMLEDRLVAPSRYGGPCPSAEFRGCQEFFKNFIQSSGGHQIFLAHLKSTLASSIDEICEKHFANNSSSVSTVEVSSERFTASTSVIKCGDLNESILTLKILAKFLGFIESLPFQYREDPHSDKLMEACSKHRQREVPCIDLIGYLKRGQENGYLILTIPWIVEFCSVLDPVTSKLPYYQQLFTRLLSIYQNVLVPTIRCAEENGGKKIERRESIATTTDEEGDDSSAVVKSTNRMEKFNAFFLTVCLGWFFEGTRFPRELFIVDNQKSRHKKILSKADGLDSQTCLNRSLLYSCCPYVGELKVILSQYLTGIKASRQLALERSDVSASVFIPAPPAERQGPRMYSGLGRDHKTRVAFRIESKSEHKKTFSELQAELERNFYHNQSISFKDTVDFIAKRVSSNLTRIFKRDTVPIEISRVVSELRANLSIFFTEKTDKELAKTVMEELLTQVDEFSAQSCKTVRHQIHEIVKSRVTQTCQTTLVQLLPDDTHPTVVQLAVTVATKRVALLCDEWAKTHVVEGFFKEEYHREFDKMWKGALQKAGIIDGTAKEKKSLPKIFINDNDKDFKEFLSCDLLIKMKEQTVQLLESRGKPVVLQEPVVNLLSDLEKSLANEVEFYNGDISDLELTLKGVETLSVDWALALCVFAPANVTSSFLDDLIGVWGGPRSANDTRTHFSFSQPPPPLLSIISPRNLTILSMSPTPYETWVKFENLLTRLLSARLVPSLALEDQCIRILRTDWDPNLLRRLSSCLNSIATSQNSSPDDRKFLDWVIWFCSNIDYDIDDDDSFPPL